MKFPAKSSESHHRYQHYKTLGTLKLTASSPPEDQWFQDKRSFWDGLLPREGK